ncbi:MAG: SDR family NAD(P)-dependent oxidoreductase [Microcella sp.]|uniref:SDR family NAD(P)-dependent oxidoreductase n=1 Tax=Microcella sp. TaxID=1913979 RepID=UPI003314AD7E
MELEGFTGRVALVTGGAGGIGATIAKTLRDLGALVAVGDISVPDHEGIMGLSLDVTAEESVRTAVDTVVQELGPPTILVLNAGIFPIEPFEETSLASFDRTLRVNLTGAFLCAREVLPHMREAGYGRVLTLGSSAGITGGSRNVAAYGASKAGVMALTKAIATEYAPHGITANSLAPALINTDMVTGIADMVGRIPVGRLGEAHDVADIAAFLCSTHAGYITGAVVDVNGGFLIH